MNKIPIEIWFKIFTDYDLWLADVIKFSLINKKMYYKIKPLNKDLEKNINNKMNKLFYNELFEIKPINNNTTLSDSYDIMSIIEHKILYYKKQEQEEIIKNFKNIDEEYNYEKIILLRTQQFKQIYKKLIQYNCSNEIKNYFYWRYKNHLQININLLEPYGFSQQFYSEDKIKEFQKYLSILHDINIISYYTKFINQNGCYENIGLNLKDFYTVNGVDTYVVEQFLKYCPDIIPIGNLCNLGIIFLNLKNSKIFITSDDLIFNYMYNETIPAFYTGHPDYEQISEEEEQELYKKLNIHIKDECDIEAGYLDEDPNLKSYLYNKIICLTFEEFGSIFKDILLNQIEHSYNHYINF